MATDETAAAGYPRDMIGYGRRPPHPKWPGGARLAVQFVINYEEGGENSVLHGDPASEAFLSEVVGSPLAGCRMADRRNGADKVLALQSAGRHLDRPARRAR